MTSLCLLPKVAKLQRPLFGNHVGLIKKSPETILASFNSLKPTQPSWNSVSVKAIPNPKKPGWTIVSVEGDAKAGQKIVSALERFVFEALKITPKTRLNQLNVRDPRTDLITFRNEILKKSKVATKRHFQANPLPDEQDLQAYLDRTSFLLGPEGETLLQRKSRVAQLKKAYEQEALNKIVTEEGINWPSLQQIVSSLTSKKPKQKR